MAQQLTDNLFFRGGYVDEIMSVDTFSDLSSLSAAKKFVGLTVTVKNALTSDAGKSIPVDVWLSEGRGNTNWVIKDIAPIDNLSQLNVIPEGFLPIGFKIALKNGNSFIYKGVDDESQKQWEAEIRQEEFDKTVADAVELAIDNITSGASEAFDTLKEVEDWIKNNSGNTQDLSDLYASAHTHNNKDILDTITLAKINEWDSLESKIPSIDGLASEVYVKNAIAEAKLSGNTNIDLTGYATKDDIKDLASKDEIKTYNGGTSIHIDNENKISVKIAADTEEKNNFIEINENNELELNTITLDAAVISEDIEVNGGAWADEVETVFDGKIPAGITFEDFLKRMLKREKFVNEFYTDRTFNVYAKEINPGLFYADKDVNNQIVEVGTKVTIKQFEPTSTKAEQGLTAGTFTYGYKVGEGGEYNSSQIYEEKITPNLISSGSILQVLCTNLTEDIEGTKPIENIYVNKANGDTMIIDTINAYVNKGYNSIKICQTGDTYATNTNIKGNNIYVATSLKKYQNSNGEDNVYNITFPESEMTATNQVVYQVTGASKYYIGGINEYANDYWNSNRSNEIINLEKSGWAIEDEIEVPYTFKVNTKQQTVAVPSEYTKVFGRDRLSGPVEFNLVKESMNFYNSQGHVSKYNVFVAPVIDGLSVDSFITITMSKK
jgi:hypothetical protein